MKMEYVYGAMLLHAAGKEINEKNLKKVLTAGGVKVDNARVKALISALEGVNIDEAINTTPAFMSPMSVEAAKTEPEEAKKEAGEEKKVEKKGEKTEEEAASGLASLFG